MKGLPNWRRLALGDVGSTNTVAMDAAQGGDAGQLWVTAKRQLQGKARRGRAWVSEEGNLYASLLLVDPAPADAIGQLPLVASVALHRAVVAAVPEAKTRLTIKWPNDLLLDGKKLSGMLLEAAQIGERHNIVIGCGINCGHHPGEGLYPSTSVAESIAPLEPAALFPHLAREMADALHRWNRGAGFAAIRDDWLSRAAGLGQPITARFSNHEKSGIFDSLDEDGYLVLRGQNGTQRISAADIFFGETAETR
ncbi:biotin--[acetyl-CoA-carboxylase] ligase [Ahrensia sp. R2A130]|uniref:biotin--[acetyl-CoA-carboxylase] ligase n=1 Tax=Ahrensia sp. R2A130 TaxID=744979 RepID=UPI00058B7296|nr:biotin--[acetyl-CoA-carboxylase] ligase [Ahrensia sp. R2A130]